MENFKQMQRKLKKAGDRAVANYEKKIEVENSSKRVQDKLDARIAQEQSKKEYAALKKDSPLQYKAVVELERLWSTGKKGFIKHLAMAFGGNNAQAYLGEKTNCRCALTSARLITFNELAGLLDKVGDAMISDIRSSMEGDNSKPEAQKLMKGRVRAITGEKTDLLLCDAAYIALISFCQGKILKGELDLFKRRTRHEKQNG